MSSSFNIIKILAGSIRNKLKEQVTHQVDHNIPIKAEMQGEVGVNNESKYEPDYSDK